MIAGAVMRARETRFSFRVLREEKSLLTERVHTRVARLTSTPATMFRVVACVTNTTTCQTFVGTPVASSALQLLHGVGGVKVSTAAAFQAVIVRVTESSSPPNPVLGAAVTFLTTVLRHGGTAPGDGGGETKSGNPAMPVILKVTQSSAASDVNGLANIVPSSSGFSGPLEVDVAVYRRD